jgi:superfamily II DNA or RNA helicase
MITVTADDKFVLINSYNTSPDLFTTINATLKMYKCRFEKSKRAWVCPIGKYDDLIKEKLEELDYMTEDEHALAELRKGKPEQEISTVRIIPNYELLNFPPLEGKHPYERFQHIGISQGLNRSRYAYIWGMGTGKTYVASALIAHYYMEWKKVGKVVMISSSIGARNVYGEILQFVKDIPKDKIYIADKDHREPFNEDADIIITSYNSFRLVCNHYKKKYKIDSDRPRKPFLPLEEWSGGEDLMLLLDESHEVANHKSYQGHYVNLHSSLFKYRYLFTGTFADKPEKMYNQLDTLDPYLVQQLSYHDWLEEYAVIGTRYSKYGISEWKKDKLEKLNEVLRKSYITEYATEDVLDLPPHYMVNLPVEMSSQHRKLYEAIILDDLRGKERSSVRSIINRFPFMLLALDNPHLLEKHRDRFTPKTLKALDAVSEKHLAKFEVVDDILEEHKGEKGILWIEHPLTADFLMERYKRYNPLLITGAVSDDQTRKQILDDFKSKKEHRLLIANIKVLNTSVTITEASFQVYVELIFAYVPYEQSSKRIYRHGQNKTVTTYTLLYNRSLDYLRKKNLDSKGMLVKGLLKKDFLSQEEWAQIFNADEGFSL